MTPPIRFLALVVGGWISARVLILMPNAEKTVVAAPTRTAIAALGRSVVPLLDAPSLAAPTSLPARAMPIARAIVGIAPTARNALPTTVAVRDFALIGSITAIQAKRAAPDAGGVSFLATLPVAATSLAPAPTGSLLAPTRIAVAPRLSGSAWMLVHGHGEAVTAGGGVLGGSQTGARLLYRINGDAAAPLSVSGRIASPLRRDGTEAAIGVEWQPIAGVPVRVLAERRQRVSGDGRSAFALLAHGGVSGMPMTAGFRLDAYAQGGIVGARSRDLFADAGATLVRPLGDDRGLAFGVGAWGGAQPGVARLDIGPRATTTFGAARVSLDWRFRVAGRAAPESGPSLTIGTDF